MPTCPNCGTLNRAGARFCYECATPLIQAVEQRPSPSADDQAWLAATLTAELSSSPSAANTIELPALPLSKNAAQPVDKGVAMEQTQPLSSSQPAPLFAGRYELIGQQGDQVEVLDRQPWRRCWSCDATTNEPGEMFCTQCGASLDGRRYHGQLITGEPAGLALVPSITDPAALEILPPIWDHVQDGDALLTLAVDTGRTPLSPPLEELDALFVGRGLAQLLHVLHTAGLALGPLNASDVELTATRAPKLRNLPGLRRVGPEDTDAIEDDLQALSKLLEGLTSTPRKTKRLDEDQIASATADAEEDSGLADLLREVRTGAVSDAHALAERLDSLIADQTRPAPMWVRIGAASHEGMVRELDEDSLFLTELRMVRKAQGQSWGLYIVADGMGGHSAGEVASDLAIRGAYAVVQDAYLAPTIDGDIPDEEARLKEVVKQAVLKANEYVLREAQSRGNDMGTTITMALVAGDRAVIGNVGDSRTYLYRDGQLRRVSKDHSLVMRLVELGQITEDEIYSHPQRNAVLRSLGDKAEITVDVFTERLKPGDALFLCSDGQWEMTRDPQMAELIKAHDDPQEACDALIDAANANGGEDNVTALLVKFEKYGE